MANAPPAAKLEGKALVTGASGFIGRRLAARLLDAGIDVLSIRRKDSPAPKRGRSVVIDYADRGALRELLQREKPDYVFHLAGATKGVTYEDFRRANVMPTENLVAAIREGHPGLRRLLHASSLAAYGPSSLTAPHTESAPRRPIEHYGQSKLEAEQAIEAAGDAFAWTIVRPGGVYGPGDADYFELFKSVARGFNVFFGNRKRLFSAVYVDDLLSAIELVAVRDATRGKGYFVSAGHPMSWFDFQKQIVAASGRNVLTFDLPELFVDVAAVGGELLTKLDGKPRLFNRQKARMGAEDAWTCSSEALERDAGFSPAVSVSEGVAKTFAWYRAERWL